MRDDINQHPNIEAIKEKGWLEAVLFDARKRWASVSNGWKIVATFLLVFAVLFGLAVVALACLLSALP